MRKLFPFFLCFFAFFYGCKEDVLPKPHGELRLEYPEPTYKKLKTDCPFTFDYSQNALRENNKSKCSYRLHYPEMKATIYMDYFPIKDNLPSLIKDAEKAVYEPHTTQATYISPKIIQNPAQKVYGTLYELGGKSALNYQFHLTDSLNHFLRGVLYFNVHPKPDSLAPAKEHVKNDIIRLMETFEWKNQ